MSTLYNQKIEQNTSTNQYIDQTVIDNACNSCSINLSNQYSNDCLICTTYSTQKITTYNYFDFLYLCGKIIMGLIVFSIIIKLINKK